MACLREQQQCRVCTCYQQLSRRRNAACLWVAEAAALQDQREVAEAKAAAAVHQQLQPGTSDSAEGAAGICRTTTCSCLHQWIDGKTGSDMESSSLATAS